MQLVFVDETGDQTNRNYFGLSLALIDSAHYSIIKSNFQNILAKNGWNKEIEFKGSCLFSASKGDTNIDIEKRINICADLLALNKAKKNARIKFAFVKIENSTDHKTDYLLYLPKLLNKVLSKAKKKNGKDLLGIHCDQRSDIKECDINKAVEKLLIEKGYKLFENAVISKSNFETVGILYADLVGYLFGRIDNIKMDIDLFESLTAEQIENNYRLKKLKTSTELLDLLKIFKAYKVD